MNIINGKEISENLKEKLKSQISEEKLKLSLAVIQIGEDEASNVYIKQKEKVSEYIGINFLHIKFNENENEDIIRNKILKLNQNKEINGIIIQLPIPSKFNTLELIDLINPNKDVDGLTSVNKAALWNGKDSIIPCTPLGIIELLKAYNIDVSGKNIVIIGRSSLVSKPLFNLLINMDATVTMCHSKTKNLANHTKRADILISATGKRNLIKKDMIKENAVIIDVGINRYNGKLSGDVDFENIKDKASYITPVPGGVGPMTVVMLMKNVIKASKIKISK